MKILIENKLFNERSGKRLKRSLLSNHWEIKPNFEILTTEIRFFLTIPDKNYVKCCEVEKLSCTYAIHENTRDIGMMGREAVMYVIGNRS